MRIVGWGWVGGAWLPEVPHDDAESELSQRCVEAIAGMGAASTFLVDADGCSEGTVDSVAVQLQ